MWCVFKQGVLLPEIGSIVLQSGGVCTQQQLLPVLHLSNSLGGRLEGKLIVRPYADSVVPYSCSLLQHRRLLKRCML